MQEGGRGGDPPPPTVRFGSRSREIIFQTLRKLLREHQKRSL